MKAADIIVGEPYAITEGTGDFDRSYDRAIKASVVKAASGGRVLVLFEEDPGRRFRVWNRVEGRHVEAKEGDTRTIKTRDVWMPWAEFVEGHKRFLANRAQQQEERAQAEARSKRLTDRIEALVAEPGEIQFRRTRYSSRNDEDITVSTRTMSTLLDLAEAKP